MLFMKRTPRIRPAQAHALVRDRQALLVCAYDDWNLCDKIRLEGALTMDELRHRLPGLSRDQSIIFYCT
jgi:hypothetical protein